MLRMVARTILLGLSILVMLLSGCDGVSEHVTGRPLRLGSLLNEAYTGRHSEWSLSALPFEVARRLQIVIDAPAQLLTLYLDTEPLRSYPVAVGKQNTPTPIGYWHIKEKDVWAGGFGERWLGLNVPWGVYGIHGTNKPWSVGTRASAGCVRMRNRDVIELYEFVAVGTPVTVRGPAFYRYGEVRRTIRRTHIGSDVAMLQRCLADLGLYNGPIDGKFGRLTETAVRDYQQLGGLPVTGVVDALTYERLGIVPLEDNLELRSGS